MLPRRCDLLIAIALWASRPPAGIDALVPIANPAADEPPMRREQRDRQREQQQEQPGRRQQRRVRYAGRYPRRFEDRHKELGGDADTMSRVLLKGGTPAGSHVPIMPAECLSRLGLLLPTATTTAEEEDHHPPLAVDDAGTAGSGRPLVVVDCTLGYGGHSRLILEALSRWTTDHDEYDDDDGLSSRRRSAVLVSFDKDSVELAKAEARLRARWDTTTPSAAGDDGVNDDGSGSTEQQPQAAATAAPPRVRLDCVHASFANVADELSRLRLPRASALLADLGCSSMQVDDPSRGFTWKADGPLDMRMDAAAAADDDDDARTTKTTPSSDHTMTRGTITAADLLAKLNTTTLAAILRDNSDFVRSDARRLAIAILADPIPTTTSELDARVRGVTPPPPETMTTTSTAVRGGRAVVVGGGGGGGSGRRPSTAWDAAAEERREILSSRVARVMQALRIEVNGEFDALDSLLGDLPRILAPGGRAVFLTFHSGEDRRVKLAMKDGMRAGHYSEVSRRVIRAGPEEVRANPRSRCSKLRWCVRSAAAT